MPVLKDIAVKQEQRRNGVMGFYLASGKVINVLGEGRLVNLACADGHAAEIMDMSFALQLLTVMHVLKNHDKLENMLYDVPEYIDRTVADAKLKSMGIEIDKLTKQQRKYLESWD